MLNRSIRHAPCFGGADQANRLKLPRPMKILKALVHALVASAFATAEAILLVDELPIARLWHRRQHG